jgi:hypothetical protein
MKAHRLREAGRRYGRRAARQQALRYPDMFTDESGVHPIRDSPGYDELEDRARGRQREQQREHERQREAYESGQRMTHATREYRQLQQAILSEGGIRANRDYKREDIPRDVYRANGKAADEMAQVLETAGYHYDGDVEMMRDLKRRRHQLERAGVLQRA